VQRGAVRIPHLQSLASLEQATGLSPDRVVNLLEAAHAAQRRGLHRRTAAMVQTLHDATAVADIELPTPERRHLDELTDDGTISPEGD
jgi:hypothetical protein